MLAQQHPQEDFHRRGVPPMDQRVAIALPQIDTHLSIELVILQQLIQPFEHRIGLGCHFRHPGKDIFWRITVYKHACSLLR
jgi:hypothetical protein